MSDYQILISLSLALMTSLLGIITIILFIIKSYNSYRFFVDNNISTNYNTFHKDFKPKGEK